jgi:hypothetical protein
MKSKQIILFTISSDIDMILKKVESSYDIHYFKMGMFDNRDIPRYKSIFDAPNIGFTLSGDWNRIDRYLIMPSDTFLNIQEYPQKAGGIRYAVDQAANPQSIELKLGGVYKEKEGVLVAGRIATISESKFSLDVFKLFSSLIRKDFKRIGSFYVGKNAEEKLKAGWRLVTNDKSPKEYDLAAE